jgi:hypothetical protein
MIYFEIWHHFLFFKVDVLYKNQIFPKIIFENSKKNYKLKNKNSRKENFQKTKNFVFFSFFTNSQNE